MNWSLSLWKGLSMALFWEWNLVPRSRWSMVTISVCSPQCCVVHTSSFFELPLFIYSTWLYLRWHLHLQWHHQERSAVRTCRSHHGGRLHDLLCDGWALYDLNYSTGVGVGGQRWRTQTWPWGLAVHGGGGEEQQHHQTITVSLCGEEQHILY